MIIYRSRFDDAFTSIFNLLIDFFSHFFGVKVFFRMFAKL